MDTFEVLVWEDEISDGSLCYSSWCPVVIGVWGQGDTEAEAIADIASAMAANIFCPWPADAPVFKTADAATAERAAVLADLEVEGISCRSRYLTMADLQAVYAKANAMELVS